VLKVLGSFRHSRATSGIWDLVSSSEEWGLKSLTSREWQGLEEVVYGVLRPGKGVKWSKEREGGKRVRRASREWWAGSDLRGKDRKQCLAPLMLSGLMALGWVLMTSDRCVGHALGQQRIWFLG
jgi:hypothetical protein